MRGEEKKGRRETEVGRLLKPPDIAKRALHREPGLIERASRL